MLTTRKTILIIRLIYINIILKHWQDVYKTIRKRRPSLALHGHKLLFSRHQAANTSHFVGTPRAWCVDFSFRLTDAITRTMTMEWPKPATWYTNFKIVILKASPFHLANPNRFYIFCTVLNKTNKQFICAKKLWRILQ